VLSDIFVENKSGHIYVYKVYTFILAYTHHTYTHIYTYRNTGAENSI